MSKTLFKLKSISLPIKYFLTNELAEKYYRQGELPKGEFASKYVSSGFYSRKLSFEEWIKHYNVKII